MANAVLFKDNKVAFSVADNRLLYTTGSPCHCCPGDCCPDGAPATYTVTLTGAVMSAGCVQCAGGVGDNGRVEVRSGNINGTYTLTRLGSNPFGGCATWSASISGPIVDFYYWGVNQDCTDPVVITTTGSTIYLCRNTDDVGLFLGGAPSVGFEIWVEVHAGPVNVTAYDGSIWPTTVTWQFWHAVWGQTNCKTGLPAAQPFDDIFCEGSPANPPPFCDSNTPLPSLDTTFQGIFGHGGTAAVSTP